jgi:hypothetical protein
MSKLERVPPGTFSSGIGAAAKSLWQGFASQRAHRLDV